MKLQSSNGRTLTKEQAAGSTRDRTEHRHRKPQGQRHRALPQRKDSAVYKWHSNTRMHEMNLDVYITHYTKLAQNGA